MSRPWIISLIAGLLLPLTAGAGTIDAGWPPAPAGENVEPMDCEPADFAKAEVVGEGDARRLQVTVEGADATVEIRLEPYVYVMQPEYWAIGVVACRSDGSLEAALRTAVAELALGGTVGTVGIEVVGRPGSLPRRFDLR